MKYRSGVQGIKFDSLTRKSKNLPNDQNNERRQHQHQTILKNRNLKLGMRPAINLATILTNKLEIDMT